MNTPTARARSSGSDDARPEDIAEQSRQAAEAEMLVSFGRWSWRAATAAVHCSGGLQHILGLPSARCSARSLCRRVDRQQRRRIFAVLRRVLIGEAADSFDVEISSDGGDTRIVRMTVRQDGGSGPPALWGVCQDVTDLHRASAQLDHRESLWETALNCAGQSVWDSDLVTGEVHHSQTWRTVRGIDEDTEDTHEAWLERVHPDDRALLLEQIRRHNDGEAQGVALEYRERHRDGHYMWISSRGAPVDWFPDGRPKRVVGTDTEITARKEAEEELARLSLRLELALEISRIGVFDSNLATGELYWDQRIRAMYGRPSDDLPMEATEWEQTLHPEDAEEARRAVNDAVAQRRDYRSEFRIVRPDGEIRTIRTQGSFYRDITGAPHMLGANWDVTEEVAAKHELETARDLAEARNRELEAARAHIEHLALHDTLTGLPNRRYLDQVLAERSAACADAGGGVALLHVDLDRFKQINDTLGHVAGDAILAHVAGLLRDSAGDGNFVARVGGDEFIVVCRYKGDRHELGTLAETIIEQLRRPVPYEGHYCRFSASVGIAARMGKAVDPQRLLINADIALYRAKAHGKNRYEFFTDALQAAATSAKRLADDILRGIEQHEFLPWYQPIFNAADLSLAGVEALVRWKHRDRGVLTPADFLGTAEDINVVTAIDRLMLEQALHDFRAWEEEGLAVPTVAVNVSFRRLHDEQLMNNLRSLDIRPGALSFELVESIFLDEPDDIIAWNLDQIRELGIGINIDDFGTGHASIISLLRLRPERLKIDRQFLADISGSRAQQRLVGSLVEIGKSLDIKVVAEGVETRAQAQVLTGLGCDMLQGYHFARPMPAVALRRFLRGGERRQAS